MIILVTSVSPSLTNKIYFWSELNINLGNITSVTHRFLATAR